MKNDDSGEPGPVLGLIFACLMAIGSIIPISILVVALGIIVSIL